MPNLDMTKNLIVGKEAKKMSELKTKSEDIAKEIIFNEGMIESEEVLKIVTGPVEAEYDFGAYTVPIDEGITEDMIETAIENSNHLDIMINNKLEHCSISDYTASNNLFYILFMANSLMIAPMYPIDELIIGYASFTKCSVPLASKTLITTGTIDENMKYIEKAFSHAEGSITSAEGFGSHAEGAFTFAKGYLSHSEGRGTQAKGDCSHAEGVESEAIGVGSHAEGASSAEGRTSHAEGSDSYAEGISSHAEGSYTQAEGSSSHAEGISTHAEGSFSHAEGNTSHAEGDNSHAEGIQSRAEGGISHAEGNNAHAQGENQHVQGKYNIPDITSAHIVGNGKASKKSNCHTIDWNGNGWFSGDVYVGSTSGTNKDAGSKKLLTEDDVLAILREKGLIE